MEQKTKQLDKALDNFIGVTAKTTIGVVVPLYGFWNDVPDNPVNAEVLRVTLERLYSNIHNLFVVFVAHPLTLPRRQAPDDPPAVTDILMGWYKRGNVKNIPVERTASYSEYVAEGIDYLLTETKASFVLVFNPWVMIQDGALDTLVDRANRGDDANVVSGYDLRSIIGPEAFDTYKIKDVPKEEWDLSCNLLAMPRFMAEMVSVDPHYKTHAFMERDLWQQVVVRQYAVVTSQLVPVFSFDFPWSDYERQEEFEADRAYFTGKWRFDPGIFYDDTRGIDRKDREGANR